MTYMNAIALSALFIASLPAFAGGGGSEHINFECESKELPFHFIIRNINHDLLVPGRKFEVELSGKRTATFEVVQNEKESFSARSATQGLVADLEIRFDAEGLKAEFAQLSENYAVKDAYDVKCMVY